MDDRNLLAEGLSRSLLTEMGLEGGQIDVFALAAHIGITALPSRTNAIAGSLLLYDRELASPRQRIRIAHELGHHLAEAAGEDPRDEALAWAIGAALLMPASSLRAEVLRRDWCLEELPDFFGVSWEVLTRRLVTVLGAVVSVWDKGRLSRRWRSPWLHSGGWSKRRAPIWEQALAQLCVEHACHLEEAHGRIRGYWVPSPGWRRVLVVSELEAWEDRCNRRGGTSFRSVTIQRSDEP